MSLSNTFVGRPVERVEDYRFLTGSGTFVADLGCDDPLHAAILRSPMAHARIRRIDTRKAAAHPGVVAVLTADDLVDGVPLIPLRQQALPEGEPYRQPVIATGRVRYVGEPVAVVLAQDQATAEGALELIELDLDELPAVIDCKAAASAETLLFDADAGNAPIVFTAEMGDADTAFAEADYTRRERLSVQRHTACPMETRGLVAEWDRRRGRVIVHGAAKVPFFNRRTLAGMLGMAEDDVDLMEVDVGGGFGARGEFYPEDFLIPYAARRLERPVRWVEGRSEHLLAISHAREAYADVEIACMHDGRVVGLRGRIEVDIGAYVRTNGFTGPRNVAQFMSGPYFVPNIALDAAVFVTNKTPAGTYRGPGRFEASYFGERLFEMAARDLGIDPVEFRRRNLIEEARMPYKLAQMRHVDPSAETWCDGGAYVELFDRCIEAFDWKGRRHLQGRKIDGRYHGLGVACFIEGGAAGPREGCRMVLERDGGVSVSVGSSAIGQGLETVLSQIAADALGLTMERIRLMHGSTTLVREGFGSFHSRSTVMGGSAVLTAADKLIGEIKAAAARRFGCEADAVTVRDGVASDGAARASFADLAADDIAVEASFSNTRHTYSYGAHAVHVAVDPETGVVEVLDYLTVEDVGRIINPATLHGQVLGAVVQGLGSVFMEHLHYDESGQLQAGSFMDYAIPVASNFPYIRSLTLELRPSPNNPLGAKGAGEGGLIAVGGAVTNAIAAALAEFGVEPRDLPLSPATLWKLIEQARRETSTGGG